MKRNLAIGLLLIVMNCLLVFAETEDPDELSIVGPRFTQLGDTIFISYRLIAPEDEHVRISVTLRRGEDTTFSIVPVSVTGAIGTVRGGGDKLILWNYKKDVPPGLQFGTDYWFQFEGTLVDQAVAPYWWHYALGGGIVAAAVILLGGSGDEETSPGSYTLPGPPGTRPPEK